ncbi:MAG: peroxiredoxin family protein [Alphaproteobacteria bacterium]|nr:peroxiredoxin family protein [Alphaproteobacteria bacterium]
MNLLKSIFVTSYMMTAMALIGFAGWMIANGDYVLGWVGVLLTAAPFMMLLSYIMMFRTVARTSERFPMLSIAGFAGVALSGWCYTLGGPMLPVGLALLGWLGFLAYAYWYSSYGGRQPSAKIKTGAPLPAFSLKSSTGATVTSAQLAEKPSVLVFFRGNWCPLCVAQVKELVARYRDLDAMGVRVAMISPQPHKNTEALAKKFDVPFDFLTDNGSKAARILGIAQNNGLPFGMQMLGYDSETVLPTVIITDAAGKVIWTHQTDNYRVRPEPDVFLDVIRKQGLVPA